MGLDVDKVCRLCLEISSNSIFSPGISNGHTLNDELESRVFECTALKVSAGDGLPESVCDPCFRLIEKFVLFRKMCWQVDKKLKLYFSQKDGKEELSTLPNPVRMDPDQVEVSLEVKSSWIKSERDSSGDEVGNGNDDEDDESDEDYVPPNGSKSMSKRAKPVYSCDMCNDLYDKLSDLRIHKEKEHPKAPKTSKPIMTCRYCNKTFKQLKRFKDHVKAHEDPVGNTDEVQGRKSNSRTDVNSDSEDEDEKERSDVKNELADEASQSQPIIGDTSNGRKKKIRKVYACEYCDLEFNSHAKYTQHELTHTGEKKYNCSDCSRSFTHKHSLIGHIKEQHTGEVNFTCDVCGRGFVHQSTFNIHKKTHSTEKPLKCPDCDKCFTQMKNLRVHRQIHSASRSHTCQVCGKSFNFMKTLKVHLVLHSGEKPYVCTYCGKGFAQSAPLKTHTRIHTGEKPYECTICPLRFSTNNALKSHFLKHSGEAPYVCEVCQKGFTRKKDMIAHQQEAHEVYAGIPGQNNMMIVNPQNNMQENCMPSYQNCMPAPLHAISPPILGPPHHMPTHQSPSPHMSHPMQPQQHHALVGTLHIPVQLHHMNQHPSPHLHPPPLHYNVPQHRTDLPGTDCSGS